MGAQRVPSSKVPLEVSLPVSLKVSPKAPLGPRDGGQLTVRELKYVKSRCTYLIKDQPMEIHGFRLKVNHLFHQARFDIETQD